MHKMVDRFFFLGCTEPVNRPGDQRSCRAGANHLRGLDRHHTASNPWSATTGYSREGKRLRCQPHQQWFNFSRRERAEGKGKPRQGRRFFAPAAKL